MAWEPEDRSKAIAFMMEKAARCTRCGTADWEWDEDPYAYTAVRQVCRGCQKLELVEDDPTETKPAGSTVVLIVRALAERLLASQQHSRPQRRRRRK